MILVVDRGKVLKDSSYNFYDRCTLSHVDDVYDKLKRDVGSDFGRKNEEKILELYSFNCGYRNIHDIKMLTCGCGKELHGIMVYRKIGDTVIYDRRLKRRTGR